ncbi:MAG TPA: HEAT repeat domain-containing protein [Planctomycetota bacterium]
MLLLLLQVTVAEGWTWERAAGPPLVERPIMASYDDRGRLYVSDSAGVNLKGAELLKDPPHRIRRLEDVDGDGVFDTSVVFADKLVFPQGLLWHAGAVYCVSPPSLWKLEDVDGDGVCDRRTELLTGFANTGVADDAHGCCLGPDGRLYFLPGRMSHDLRYPDGTRIKKAVGPWLMRIRFDGRDAEIVSGAQGNPVEVAWLPEGDFFISGTFWAPDAFGGGLRDALIHGVEGGEYAVRDRVYNDRIRTGDFLPPLVPMPATAPSGLTALRTGELLGTYFNTRRVQRHVLERDGASFRARTEDFAVSESADFHPTDVLEAPDGSVLVVDTGGWFRIGCPTSQIAKPQVLGGIYRMRRKVPVNAEPSATEQVWALTRADKPSRQFLDHADPRVRQAAATSAGLVRDAEAVDALCRLVRSDLPQIRREAATSLGRLGQGTPALLESLRSGVDRFLEHAIVFALIRIGDREALTAALQDRLTRRAALIALDQLGDGLSRDQVTPLLDPGDVELQRIALRVIVARGWAKEVFGLVRQWVKDGSQRELLQGVVVGFAKDPAMRDLVALSLRAPETPADSRLALLEAMTRVDAWPATWLAEARWSLDHADERVVRQAVAVLRTSTDCDDALAALARDEGKSAETRIDALGAVTSRLAKLEAGLFRFLLDQLGGAPLTRLAAAEALGRAPLDDGQLNALSGLIGGLGALELPRLIGAYGRSGNAAVGKKLVAALEVAPGAASLSAEALKGALAKQPEDVRKAAEPLLKRLSADVEAQKAKLAGLKEVLAGGDAKRGREIFLGRKAGCVACHAAGGQGGRVGPDLSKIGSIRHAADLLEAVVFPSATFARGFEPFVVRTKDGGVTDGLIVRETAESIVVFTADRTEKRIPRAAVDAVRESKISIMPQGLDAQLTKDELRDLLAFLGSLK